MRAVVVLAITIMLMAMFNNQIVSLVLLAVAGSAGLFGLLNARVKGGEEDW